MGHTCSAPAIADDGSEFRCGGIVTAANLCPNRDKHEADINRKNENAQLGIVKNSNSIRAAKTWMNEAHISAKNAIRYYRTAADFAEKAGIELEAIKMREIANAIENAMWE